MVYGTNLYHKTMKQLMKFNNDNTGNKLICVHKTTTFSRLQLQEVTLRCKVDRSQLSENLLLPSSPINFRPGNGGSRFPGNFSTCLSKAVQHYATFRNTEIFKLLGKTSNLTMTYIITIECNLRHGTKNNIFLCIICQGASTRE